MHMWMWFGYDLGEFLFSGLEIHSRWAFALTWIVLFFVALLFEGSKVYLARVQREAHKKLNPYRCDERRNLLCDRTLVNTHQTLVFVTHNVVGYLLMLAVMVYNVHLLLAVVFGMMLGYFLFGTKLTKLQMQCFSTKRMVICTPECDDTAESSSPPLLGSTVNSESDYFICQTRSCVQPAHYYAGESGAAACHHGAKRCPSKVARARSVQAEARCSHAESEKEDSPGVEDAQLLRPRVCCKSDTQHEQKCCSTGPTTTALVHDSQPSETSSDQPSREESPQITCCHNAKSKSSDSQEHIVK